MDGYTHTHTHTYTHTTLHVAGTALVRGLQRPLHAAAGQLGAQLALTYFVPLATTAAAMLARIKVGQHMGM